MEMILLALSIGWFGLSYPMICRKRFTNYAGLEATHSLLTFKRSSSCWIGSGNNFSSDIIKHFRSSLHPKHAQEIDTYIKDPQRYDKTPGSPLVSFLGLLNFNIGNWRACGGDRFSCCLIKLAGDSKVKTLEYIENNPGHPITKECIEAVAQRFLKHWYSQEKEFCHRDIFPGEDGYKDIRKILDQEREKYMRYQEILGGVIELTDQMSNSNRAR